MHLFIPIVAAGITLYLLRNWWERLQYQREERRLERAINPSPPSRSAPWIAMTIALLIMAGMAALTIVAYS